MKLLIERIFAYCFDMSASKAPSDEGAGAEARTVFKPTATEGENFALYDQYTHIHRGNFGQYPSYKSLLLLGSWRSNHCCAVHLFCLLRCIMSSTIKFNNQPRFGTIKICDIVSYCFLSLKANRIVAQKSYHNYRSQGVIFFLNAFARGILSLL